MTSQLRISVGQHSDKGRKPTNQDFHGIYFPREPQLSSKGIALAVADGISSSDVSQVASESAVKTFLQDYYCTSDAWSVKTSAERVLAATNSWLHSQTQQSQWRYDKDRGYVCTLSAIVLKSTTAHLFHVGDSRVYRLNGRSLEQLTVDHRIHLSPDQSYLSRALGVNGQLEIDYRTFSLEKGDVFLLATDGVYEHVDEKFMVEAINGCDGNLDHAARAITDKAFERGSGDNLTVQIVKVEELPSAKPKEIYQQLAELPFPPLLDARMEFDGYRIVRELHASNRSHVYLAIDPESDQLVVIKAPSVDLQNDVQYVERFLMEEWIARRLNSPHVLKPCMQTRKRNFIYLVTEYIDGQTLTQWMRDHPKPDLNSVRGIIEQVAKGLRAFHRLEMLHQDLRPENIMIDRTGTAKIIDFGATRVAGLMETQPAVDAGGILGTTQYTAPEYFLGESGSGRSDLFSLGVITYQMLTGRLPYGTEVSKSHTRAAQRKLAYQTVRPFNPDVPAWINGAIAKAVAVEPTRRYTDVSEFVFDLRHPNREFMKLENAPLLERNPLLFWKSLSLILAIMVVCLLKALYR